MNLAPEELMKDEDYGDFILARFSGIHMRANLQSAPASVLYN